MYLEMTHGKLHTVDDTGNNVVMFSARMSQWDNFFDKCFGSTHNQSDNLNNLSVSGYSMFCMRCGMEGILMYFYNNPDYM